MALSSLVPSFSCSTLKSRPSSSFTLAHHTNELSQAVVEVDPQGGDLENNRTPGGSLQNTFLAIFSGSSSGMSNCRNICLASRLSFSRKPYENIISEAGFSSPYLETTRQFEEPVEIERYTYDIVTSSSICSFLPQRN